MLTEPTGWEQEIYDPNIEQQVYERPASVH